MDYMDGDDVIDGDDQANVLGAVARQLRSRGNPRRVFASPPLPARPVQGNTSELRSYMGFGFVTWVTVDGADKVITIEPQESFRGERLIIDVTAVGGAAAGLTLLRRIDIGTMPQSPSVEAAAPASMFARDATNANLDLQIAYRGTKVQITLGQTAAPGAGVTVTAAIGMFGQWIR
jgi:hypothetical protein